MFSKFNQKNRIIFLDLKSPEFSLDERVDIILSPSLYWVKKVSLPVKYIREVKPLLPSLFEGHLPEGNYSYSAYKEGKEFFIFAYEDKFILDTLKSKGIVPTQINKVYFSQSEFSSINRVIKIDDARSIYKKDDIVLLLPNGWIEDDDYALDLEELELSKHAIVLKQFGHIVEEKNLNIIIGIFSLFIVTMFIEYYLVSQKIEQTQELRDEVFVKNELKSTMIQNRALLKEYESSHTKQMNFRKASSSVLSLRLARGQKITLISLKSRQLLVEFSGVKSGFEKALMQQLQQKGVKFKQAFKRNIWSVEISL